MFKSTSLPFDISRQIDGQITRKRKRLTKVGVVQTDFTLFMALKKKKIDKQKPHTNSF